MRATKTTGAAFGAWLLFAPAAARAQGAMDPRDARVLEACGPGDARLAAVAQTLAARRLAGQALPDSEGLARLLREEGAPFPWPRWLVFDDRPVDRSAATVRLRHWVTALPRAHWRRCGVASAHNAEGRETVVVVAAPALGEFDAVPRYVPVGQWVETRVRILADNVMGARFFVLGPTGSPFTPPAWYRDGQLVARFLVDRPGQWKIQTLADLPDGPAPVAETWIQSGVATKDEPTQTVGALANDRAIVTQINAERAAQQRTPVRSDPVLDAVARNHAERLAHGTTPVHDTGQGDAAERATRAGVIAGAIGENVAHGPTLTAAHRNFWTSPSHRHVLLTARFRTVGVGTAQDPQGAWWLVELFADSP